VDALSDRKNAGKMPALPLKTQRSRGHGAQRAAPLHGLLQWLGL